MHLKLPANFNSLSVSNNSADPLTGKGVNFRPVFEQLTGLRACLVGVWYVNMVVT